MAIELVLIFLEIIPHQHICMYDMEKGEELACPWLFPCVQHKYKNETKTFFETISTTPTYSKDGRWGKDICYLLQAVNEFERKRLLEDTQIYVYQEISWKHWASKFKSCHRW